LLKVKKNLFYRGVSKLLTFSNSILQNFTNRVIPFNNIHDFTRDFLKVNHDIKSVIITGNPFEIFRFGYLLNKKYGIKWMADYRDDWTTSELRLNRNLGQKLIQYLERKSEKKWVGTSEIITSVSPYYVNKISNLTGKKGEVILNGFDPQDVKYTDSPTTNKAFTIIYSGTLYSSQPIEIFLDGLKMAINKIGNDIHFYCVGLGFDKLQERRVRKNMKEYESYLTISNRIPKSEAIEIQKEAETVLMLSHTGLKGIPSSKLFEYIGLQKPVLLVPSDNDIIENILSDTNLGLICNNAHEVKNEILSLYDKFKRKRSLLNKPDIDRIKNYTNENQTAVMAQSLNRL